MVRVKLSVLDGAPTRSVESSFMGLMETLAWVGLRNERAALGARWHSLDRPDLDQDRIHGCLLRLADDMGARGVLLHSVRREVIDRCASGAIQAKGKGGDGFADIPADDWFGATLFAGKEPDTLLRSGPSGTGWTHVQFRRSDVTALWPEIADAEAPAKPISVQSQTNKRPKWYPALLDLMAAEDRRLRDFAERKPDKIQPLFPTAAAFRRKLIAQGFPETMLPEANVRYHVSNIKTLLGR